MTVKAIAIKKYGYEDSKVLTEEYTLPKLSDPTSSYEEGTYDSVLYVNL